MFRIVASPAKAGTQLRSAAMDTPGFVYIMASGRNGILYLGSTDHLPRRAWEHRNAVIEGFTKEHGCHLLVWFQAFESIVSARQRERQMKGWKRGWKIREIEGLNPDWADLFDTLTPM